MSHYLFNFLLISFIILSVVFLVLGAINVDSLLLVIAVLFAICAVLSAIENKANLNDPFSH